jgi:signal transduction histidine kinase
VTAGAKDQGQYEPTAQLWAQATHDLRQPVQGVLLLMKMLDHPSAGAEQKRTVRQIQAALLSLHDMLEVLNLLSRIEAGVQIVQLCACSLADILGPIVKEMAGIAAARGVTLTCRRTRGVVRSNPELLATAIRSLFLNAIEFGNGGDILGSWRRRSGQLRLEVRFRGVSLDAARERNAFVQLSPRTGGPIAGDLGLGPVLLEHLCRRLDHDLQYTRQLADEQLLALELPLLAAAR